MRLFFSLALIGLFTSLSAQETIIYPYNPDSDNDQYVAVSDVLSTISTFGSEFLPTEIQIDGVGLLQVIQELQNQLVVLQQSIDDNALPDGIFSGDILIWNGTAWVPEPPLDDCGVFGGDNSTCADCCGVPNGNSSTCYGTCGACNDDTSCLDDCGVPNGDNSTCFTGCGDGIMHDGHDYSTVQIGDQCWFSENCRYLPSVSPSSSSSPITPYSYVYGYEGSDVAAAKATANYATYGALYNWPAVMEPGICPSGWHIPTDFEWQTLEISLGMSVSDANNYGWRGSPVGDYMKSTSGWDGGGNGSNSSGFSGLPGGLYSVELFYSSGNVGAWWSASESSENGSSFSSARGLSNNYDNVSRDSFTQEVGFSARCVIDYTGECGDGIMHDGHDYSTVQIGDQCWFSENCRYLPSVSPSSSSSPITPYSYVYGYEGSDVAAAKATANYATYGALYNWTAVMEPGICPSGWHIPTDLEWQTLEISLGMSVSDANNYGWRGSPVGDYMKSTSGWDGGGNGSNWSGFSGLPGGLYSDVFYLSGNVGAWWSASEYSENVSNSWGRALDSNYGAVDRLNFNRNYGFSARCVRD